MFNRLFPTAVAITLTAGFSLAAAAPPAGSPTVEHLPGAAPPVQTSPTVDLAICLDTSGSMSGLIESAKQKLWAIVNELALAEPTPTLRVALFTFGNNGHDPENGWVKLETGLTEDLDLVSQQLFSMSTNGGTELVGRVLQASVDQLEWHPSESSLKIIVVAGNESADQDQVTPFREQCKRAITQDIIVNSIYCGDPNDEIAPGWREVALLADGRFAVIDQNQGTVVIESPFDKQLISLSAAINDTYIPYGERGTWAAANQIQQDQNAAELNEAASAARCQTKGSALYDNRSWDLVDACAKAVVKLEDIADEDLPEAMRGLTLEEKKAYVDARAAERADIQKQIAAVTAQRRTFIEQEMARQALDDTKSFDYAIRQAIREQARTRGLRFPEPPPAAPAEGDATPDAETPANATP